MRLEHHCPTCNKPAEVQCEIPMGLKNGQQIVNYVYRCGHIELREAFKSAAHSESMAAPSVPTAASNGASTSGAASAFIDPSFYSLSAAKCAYEFQRVGVDFAESNGFNVLIADAMGLGKTVQSSLILKRNAERLLPTLVLTRSSIIYQFARELKEWADNGLVSVMPLTTRSAFIPGFKYYVMSMDMLSRKGVLEALLKLNIKSVILDEVHFYKDPSSKRTRSLITFLYEAKIDYKIALSGTPIKNRADEYFTILNLLAPSHFRSREEFRRNWLVQNEKGAYTRINPYRLEEFKRLISRWVIRREKHEVLTNLPPLTRDYQYVEIEDPQIKQSYNNALSLFDNFLRNTARVTSQDILGWLAKLRSITGQAKCQNAIEWAQEFLDSNDESLAIGIQHKAVRDSLYYVFEAAGYEPLKLSGEDLPERKNEIQRHFNEGRNRLLVINSLAGGIGLNLQSCANALVLERQWNSADEEQFEGRFHRDGQKQAVTVTYMMARGTIDEWFHDMVERKRRILGETVSSWSFTNDEESLKDLAQTTIRNRLN